MKKVTQVICAVIIGIGAVNFTSPVNAEEATCDSIVITNTGAGSNNNGTCVINTTVSVKCTNNIYVLDANDQTAVTGAASSLGSTNSSTVISGNATNSNNQTVQIGATCAEETTSAPVTPTAPTTPVAAAPITPSATSPRGGAGAASAAAPQTVAALPYTATNNVPAIIAAVIATMAALFAASRLAIVAYRRTNQK